MITIGEQIYQSPFKPQGDGTFAGEYDGQDAIVKRGDERLLHEAAVLRSASHDSIPKLFAIEQDEDKFQLAMSRLAGIPLSELMELDADWNSTPYAVEDAVRITQGIAESFIAVKNAGYLYRDLNLGHVIVSQDRVGLCDHEADVLIGRNGLGVVDTRSGTWETMAPEEFEVGNTMSESANTYTLGVLLLQLCEGHSRFHLSAPIGIDGDEARKLGQQTHLNELAIVTGTQTLDRVLHKALAPNPSDRYQRLRDFHLALKTISA